MTPEELNTAIYHKMEAEQDSYRDWLLTLPPDEILQHAYEYAVRQDILFAMEDLELQPEQCQALMKSPCPVADVLRDFEKLELGYMETLRDCIEGRADKLKYGALFEQNNDFVGWISIDETSIHYPVMQTPDNPDYYLKHGFDKAYSNYGVPYIDEGCAPGLSNNIVNRRYYPTPYDWRRIGEYVAAALAVFAVCEALTASADNMFVSYAFNTVLLALYAAYLVRRERIDLGAMLRAFLHR